MLSKNTQIINKITEKICASLNYKKQSLHEPYLGTNEKNFVNKCLKSGFVSSAGKMISEFENEINKITKSKYAISVVNGTEAIKISLVVAGVKPNDEVLVPSLTFVGSVSPIVQIGATPHFIDSNLDDFGIDFQKLEKYLKENTLIKKKQTINKKTGKVIKAIVPVHIFGQPCKIDKIVKLCKKFNILVIEDAAEGLGSYYKNKHVGLFGKLGCISFNGNKIITTGSGGMIITNNKTLAKKARHLIQTAKIPHKYEYIHDEIGFNSRMSNLNASLGLGQIRNFKKFLKVKRKIHNIYKKNLKDINEIDLYSEKKYSKSNYWLQAIILKNNYEKLKYPLLAELHRRGVGARPVWKLISTLKPYRKFPKMNLSGSNKIYLKVINLPSGPGILLK